MSRKPAPARLADLVIVVWLPAAAADAERVNLLTCHDGVRGFEKDRCDPRCGKPPYFPRLDDGAAWAAAQGGGPLHAWQVPVPEAQRRGLLDGARVVDFSV